ncbi:hypothetical protein, partial [Escherichia coli]
GTADRNRSHWSTSKTPSYTKSVSWQHHQNQFEIYIHLININLFSGNIFKLNGSISLLNFNE